MTAPDPVRAALEAAASSLRRPWPSFPTRGMTAEQQRQRAHEMAAAATIAAFLRALPVGLRGVPGAIRGGHAPAVMPHYLANAVAAAKETPDE